MDTLLPEFFSSGGFTGPSGNFYARRTTASLPQVTKVQSLPRSSGYLDNHISDEFDYLGADIDYLPAYRGGISPGLNHVCADIFPETVKLILPAP